MTSSWNTTTMTTSTTATPMTIYVTPSTITLPSAGHVPSYQPPALAEDELMWLRRRITEVTDLFPVAA